MNRLEELIDRGPVLFDGAMGTELNARGVAVGHCLEEVNLTQPALVLAVHREYIAAGGAPDANHTPPRHPPRPRRLLPGGRPRRGHPPTPPRAAPGPHK